MRYVTQTSLGNLTVYASVGVGAIRESRHTFYYFQFHPAAEECNRKQTNILGVNNYNMNLIHLL